MLVLSMKAYNTENGQKVFLGKAIAKIKIFVTA